MQPEQQHSQEQQTQTQQNQEPSGSQPALQPPEPLATFPSEVTAVAFAANGRKVAVGLKDGQIELWDLVIQDKWATFIPEDGAAVTSVALSQDGKTLLSGSEDNTVRLWDISNPSTARATFRHDYTVTSVALSQDGRTLLSGSRDKTARLWDVDNPGTARAIFRHDNEVWSVAATQDGKTLLSGSWDGTLRLWDMDNPNTAKATFSHDTEVNSVAVSQDGKTLLSGSSDGTARLWDVDNPSTARAIFRHNHRVWFVALSQDGKTLLSNSEDNTVCLWDIDNPATAKATFRHDYEVWPLALSQDGKTLLSGSNDKTVRLWDVDNPSTAKTIFRHGDRVTSIALSQDGKTLLSGSWNGTLYLWDMDNPSTAKAIFDHAVPMLSSGSNCVALSQDSKTFLSGSSLGVVYLWDVDNPSTARAIFHHGGTVTSVALSQDGQTILSGSWEDKTVRLWDVDNPSTARATFHHDDGVWSVALSQDGKTFFSGGSDRTVRLWDVDNPSTARATFQHDNVVTSVVLSQDGKTLLSGSRDNTVRLWDVDNPSAARATFQHDNPSNITVNITPVALSHDGKTLLSVSWDRKLILWDLTDPQYKRSLLIGTHPGEVYSVAFDPNGDYIFSAGEGGIKAWRWKKFGVQRIPQTFKNDQPGDEDQLAIEKELRALADVLMLRSLEPPLAVAILGGWGSGKSFAMNLIKKHITAIRCRALTSTQTWAENADDPRLSPYVGHIYQIKFDAWTYAKSDLWASLMQTIFSELNRQLTLEKQLAKIGSMQQRQALEDKLEQLRSLFSTAKSSQGEEQTQAIQEVQQKPQPASELSQETASDSEELFPQELAEAEIKQFETILTALKPDAKISEEQQHDPELGKFWLFLHKTEPEERKTLIKLAEKIKSDESNFLLEEQDQEFWQILNILNDAERKILVDKIANSKLEPEAIQKWKTGVGKGTSLWDILGELKKEEQATLQATEQELKTLKQRKNWLEKQLQQHTEQIEQKRDRDNEKLALIRAFWSRWQATLQGNSENSILQEISALMELKAPGNLTQLEAELSKQNADLEQLRKEHSKTIDSLIENATQIEAFLEDKPRRKLIGFIEFARKNRRMLLVFLLWLLLPLLIYILFNLLPIVFPSLKLHEWAAQIFSSLKVALIALVSIPGLNQALSILKQITVWQAKINREFQAFQETVEAERQQLAALQPKQDNAQIEELQQQLDTTQSKITKLEIRAEAQRRQAGLTVQYGSLLEFVTDRLEEDSYQKRLGLMHQIKHDLEDLSDRLTCDLKYPHPDRLETLKKHFPRGSARVVLYIDDLDRCPPKRVVQVLEAIQLLLTTKLFIVIIAVDDRYINRALEKTYQDILKRRGTPSGVDYLEKIIQIPYRMRAIAEKSVLENYLRSQLDVKEEIKRAARDTVPDQAAEAETKERELASAEEPTRAIERQPSSPVEPVSSPQLETSNGQTNDQTNREENLSDRSDDVPKTSDLPQPVAFNSNLKGDFVEIAQFTEDEFKTILDCCQYVDLTPRTTKRIINLCKILRLIWTPTPNDKRWEVEPPLEVKETVIAFLALSGRYPNQIRCVLEELNVEFEDLQLKQLCDSPSINDPERPKIKKQREELLKIEIQKEELLKRAKEFYPLKDSYMEREWKRFSKDVEQVPPRNGFFALEQRTFNLLLSFCFVGDVGYDPDDVYATPTSTAKRIRKKSS